MFKDNLHLDFSHDNKSYHIDLVQGQKSDTAIVINGVAYSILTDEKQLEEVKTILSSIHQTSFLSLEDLQNRITESDNVSSNKLHKIGVDILDLSKTSVQDPRKLTKEERQMAVENQLIPSIPSPSQGLKPTNIKQRMEELGVPGASIAVIYDGKIDWTSGYGELAKPVFVQAASISKTVAALTMLSLIDQCAKAEKEGTVSGLKNDITITLDTDIRTLLDKELMSSIDPEGLAKGDNAITIKKLLSHTAGTTVSGFDGYPRLKEIDKEIQELSEKVNHLEQEHKNRQVTTLDIKNLKKLKELNEIKFHAKEEPLTTDDILKGKGNSPQVKFDPNLAGKFNYSGGGTTILQKVIEELTGDFKKAVEERVFKKLEMKGTYTPKESEICQGNGDDALPIPGGWNHYPELAAAGLWTTPIDLAKMAMGIQAALSGKEDGVISQESAKKMLKSQTSGKPNGLGIMVQTLGSSTFFAHEGSNLGFKCVFLANSEGDGAVVMTNSEYGDHLYKEVLKSIAEVYKWEDMKLHPVLEPSLEPEEIKALNKSVIVNIKNFEKYIGKYEFGGHVVDVSLSKDKIVVQVDKAPSFDVTPITEKSGVFRATDPGPSQVVRFNEDSINLYGFTHMRQPKK